MIVSEARRLANARNARLSTGPRTEEGKAVSRANALKHGLTAEVVVAEEDAKEIDRRREAFLAEMAPRTGAGALMIATVAAMSVRIERAGMQELAAIAYRVRHAEEDFDDAREDLVDTLFQSLADDPRRALRRLRRMPEGVVRLVDAWEDLRNDLLIAAESGWTAEQLAHAACLTGLPGRHAPGTRLAALNLAVKGDFSDLLDDEGAGLDAGARRAWALGQLLESIDAEVKALKEHHQTLDFETLEADRAEAPLRAMFDPSKEATLARRYEAEASRRKYKALDEYRRAEGIVPPRAEPRPKPKKESRPEPSREVVPASEKMGSFREPPASALPEPVRARPEAPKAADPVVRDDSGRSRGAISPVLASV